MPVVFRADRSGDMYAERRSISFGATGVRFEPRMLMSGEMRLHEIPPSQMICCLLRGLFEFLSAHYASRCFGELEKSSSTVCPWVMFRGLPGKGMRDIYLFSHSLRQPYTKIKQESCLDKDWLQWILVRRVPWTRLANKVIPLIIKSDLERWSCSKCGETADDV